MNENLKKVVIYTIMLIYTVCFWYAVYLMYIFIT